MIKLSEIFCSLQGESTFAGIPCIFIRFAGCNLRCSYCDAQYAFDSELCLSVEEIASKIRKWDNVKLVEITGGEPLEQRNECILLIERLHELGYTILMETNGSHSIEDVPGYVHRIIDVKCPDSGSGNSFNPVNLDFITPNDEVKFVLSSIDDYRFAKDFVQNHEINTDTILFSVNTDKLILSDIADRIVEDQLYVRMQLQMHKYVWPGEDRGK